MTLHLPLPFSYAKTVISFIFLCALFLTSHVVADTSNDLLEKYDEIEDDLFENIYDIPIYLESNVIDNTMRGDVFGILHHPFETVRDALKLLENWCEIMPQHLNIKACTYQYANNQCKLSFYSGRKFYQKADDVYLLNNHFNVTTASANYFNASLMAKEGPFDTQDYKIRVQAIPLTESSTFIHFSYEYKYGFWTRIAMSGYLATLGSSKIGFTVKEMDEYNKPVYIKGTRGIIERNAIRYYFAIQSYMDSQVSPLDKRFESRISNWFDLTENYHQQLHEMNKDEYLKYKKMERQDQIRLQKIINEKDKSPRNLPLLQNKACLLQSLSKKSSEP